MAEGVVAEIKAVPGDIRRTPWTAIGIGILFLVLVLIIEAYKPGMITGPIKSFLAMFGIKAA